MTENPNRGKRRAGTLVRPPRTSCDRRERTASGELVRSGVTIVQADPARARAALRSGRGTAGIVASAEREIRGKRHQAGTAMIARNVTPPSAIPARREAGARAAEERTRLRATSVDRIMDRAERAERRGNFALAAHLLELAAALDAGTALAA